MRSLILAFLILIPTSCFGSMEEGLNATCRLMALREKLYPNVSEQIIDGWKVDKKGEAAGEKVWYGGTGAVFKIENDRVYILTAAHVLHGAEEVNAQFFVDGFPSGRLPAKIEWSSYQVNTTKDLAVISVAKKAFGKYKIPKPIPIAEKGYVIKSKQTVTSSGCSSLNWPSSFKGHVVRPRGFSFQFSPVGLKGRSGSPVFDAKCEKIIGVIIWFRVYAGEAVSIEGIYHYWGEKDE